MSGMEERAIPTPPSTLSRRPSASTPALLSHSPQSAVSTTVPPPLQLPQTTIMTMHGNGVGIGNGNGGNGSSLNILPLPERSIPTPPMPTLTPRNRLAEIPAHPVLHIPSSSSHSRMGGNSRDSNWERRTAALPGMGRGVPPLIALPPPRIRGNAVVLEGMEGV